MAKQFEIVFPNGNETFVAELLEDKAPITCEHLWKAIEKPLHEKIQHGGETGPEMWCFIPPPSEEIPYENSTVFPEHGEILFYHYRQPPTRDGMMVYDIGIYWDRGCSKLRQGWIPGNLFAKITGQIKELRRVAGRLLMEGPEPVVIRRKE
ncbi:MAG: DUF3830 family protein [Candidatus Zixiibacteriota bacterium]